MGQLTELGFATSEVKVARGVLVLRGLSVEDVLRIARANGEAFTSLFAKFTAEDAENLDLADTGRIAVSLAESAPAVVADIIAHAADDPAAREIARRLPFATQVECLEAIARLTFEMEGGAKKVLETLLRMASAVGALLSELRQQKSGSLG